MTLALARAAVLPLVVSANACGSKDTRNADDPPGAATKAATAHVEREARALRREQPLPRLARAVLDESMLEHGDHMESLLWASLLVDYETTRVLAEEMASAPRIARPLAGNDLLNAVFPPRFFALQDELYLAIDALGAAASAKNDSDMAATYARLATTCVTCHSIYLRTSLPEPPSRAATP